jgi:nucleoporin NUP159
MDIALDNQTNDVERLTARISKLNMNSGQRPSTSSRDARLPDPVTRQRPFNVTPHVAVTTAAALNAERSAHKLKRALLSVRKEPLLNTQAASAPPAPLAFNTPQRVGLGLGLGLGLGAPVTPMRGMSLGLSPSPSTPPQSTMLGFDFPDEDNFNPSPPPATRRGAGGSGKTRISNSVPLKRSPGQPSATPSPPPAFDWGPLPNFQKKISPENSLGGSWVSDGFGSKKS